MSQLLIRDIEPETIERLKLRAKLNHRSLQGELKSIVEAATKMSIEEVKNTSAAWRKRLANSRFTDSSKLLREDRER